MKTEDELRTAYELLTMEIERLKSGGGIEGVLLAMHLSQVREVLCYALDHGHKNDFGDMIADLQRAYVTLKLDGTGGLDKCQPH